MRYLPIFANKNLMKSRKMNTKTIRKFFRILKIEENCGMDRNALTDLKNWGREKILKKDNILCDYVNYKNVLNDYTNILSESRKKTEDTQIEKVANYVGLTTNYGNKGTSKSGIL